MIAIADYGVGNLLSVVRMFRKAGADARLVSSAEELLASRKVVLPGVGHFGHCALKLREAPFFDALQRCALDEKKPILGICVGAQLLGQGSEEAHDINGLGWLDMRCRRFPDRPGYRVPRMGWGKIVSDGRSPLLGNLGDDSRFYFVHSYYMDCADPDLSVGTTNYEIDYTCVVQKGNITGIQFHPEKSLRHGLGILKAFAESYSAES